MTQKNIVYVPANTERLKYNEYYRDFDVERLDFGRVVFVKSVDTAGKAPQCFVYDTRQGEPFFYSCPIDPNVDNFLDAD